MKKFFLVVLVLCSIHCWGYWRLWYYRNYTDLLSLLFLSVSVVNMIYDDRLQFKKAIFLFISGIGLNILSAYFNNGQGIKDTTLSFGYYYFIIFYFWLHEAKPKRAELEILILVFAIIYTILNQIQIQEYPRRLFHGTLFADRGTVRMRVEGASFLVLAYFMLLNKYLMKRKLVHIILAMIFLFVIIRGGTRTFTAAAILLSGVVFLKLVKYSPTNYFLIILAVILFIGMLQMESTSKVIEGMVNTTEKQKEQGDRYIRVMQYEYFTEEYPKNWSYYIFGGGLPGGYGAYSKRMGYMVGKYGFFWVDQGLLGFYLVIGLITTLGLLWWTFKAVLIKLPPDCLYLNIYFAFLFLASTIVMDEIFAPGIFGIQAIALYMIDECKENREQTLASENEALNPVG